MTVKNALVVGMARSGIAAARLLKSRGARVLVNDSKPREAFNGALDTLEGVEFHLGQDPVGLLGGIDALIISPGVPDTAPVVRAARDMGIEVLGELEYAYRESAGLLVAITGTNGKTTTTTLTSEIFKNSGKRAFAVGNIGDPYSGAAGDLTSDDVTVCEVSSFQLETVSEFHPQIAAVLNITEDHLNRHGDMATYIALKERVFMNCRGTDSVVLNWDDPVTRGMAKDANCRVIWFSTEEKVPFGAFVDSGIMVYGSANSFTPVCAAADLLIPGRHNLSNALAATAIAMASGVPADVIRETLRKFRSVEHRIEFTRELSGVWFYNDSKGTNVDSTIQAVRAMARKTVLIAGGFDKHADFLPLADEIIKSNVKNVVLIGKTADQIAGALEKRGFTAMESAGFDFQAAIDKAYALADEGWSVLLSPACASFDMFSDYEARGREFKRIVKDLEPKDA